MKCWVLVTISHQVLVRSVLSPYTWTKPLQTEKGAHRERVHACLWQLLSSPARCWSEGCMLKFTGRSCMEKICTTILLFGA